MPPTFQSLAQASAWYGAWLKEDALPLWSTAGVDEAFGGFHEALTPDGRPAGVRRRARVQSRQIWVYAAAARWEAGYGALARRAYDNYLARYRRADGLFVFSTDPEGAVSDAAAALYEQAFSLLAMAGLRRRADAEATRAGLEALRHDAGGFREVGPHPFQANAHMHLLEAALAWEDAGDASWAPLADEIAELALGRFIEPESGYLWEFFDDAWRPLPEAAGGLIEPGHQFEWAWLLDRWGARRGRADAVATARRLYSHGLAGIDPARGVAVGAVWSDGRVREPLARLWAQTEWIRAALAFGGEGDALVAAQGLAPFLDTPARGAWRDKLGGDDALVEEPAPATSLYHLMAGLLPLLDG